MKAYFPESHTRRETRKRNTTVLLKLAVLTFLILGLGFLSSGGIFKELDNSIYGLLHRSLSYSRVAPSSVIIVRYIEDPDEHGELPRFPDNSLIVEGLRKITAATPKYFFEDYITGLVDTSPEERDALKALAQKVPTAFSTSTSFDTYNGIFKPVRFKPAPELEALGANYTYDAGASSAVDFSFGTDLRVSDPWFLDAWQKVTGNKLPDGIERSMIHFYGSPGTIKSITLKKLATLSDDEARALLTGRTVFLGFQTLPWKTNERTGDARTKVYQDAMADTEIRATIAANLLDGSYYRVPNKLVGTVITYAMLLILFAKVIFRTEGSLGFLVLFTLSITLGECLAMQSFSYWIPGLSLLYLASFIAFFVSAYLLSKNSHTTSDQDDYFSFGKCKF